MNLGSFPSVLTLLIVLALVSLEVAFAQLPCRAVPFDTCYPQGTCFNGYCACNSGWAGTQFFALGCDQTTVNCSTTSPFLVVTGNNSYINQNLTFGFRNQSNNIQIVLENSFVFNRTTTISFANSGLICSHPGPYWEKTIVQDVCVDRFTFNIPYPLLRNCTDPPVSENGFWILRGFLNVVHTELLGYYPTRNLNLTRTLINHFRVEVSSPTVIRVNANLTIGGTGGTGGLLTAIILSELDRIPLNFLRTGNVQLYTNLPWPFRFRDDCVPTFLNPRSDITISARLLPSNETQYPCPLIGDATTNPSTCGQVFALTFSLNLEACNMTGNYIMLINNCLECRTDLSNQTCPLDLNNTAQSVELQIESEDVCAITLVAVPVYLSTPEIFLDPNFQIPVSGPLYENQTYYFRIEATSERSISSIRVIRVEISRSGIENSTQVIRVGNTSIIANVPCGDSLFPCGDALSLPSTEIQNRTYTNISLTIDTAVLFRRLSDLSDFTLFQQFPTAFILRFTVWVFYVGQKRDLLQQPSYTEQQISFNFFANTDQDSFVEPEFSSSSMVFFSLNLFVFVFLVFCFW